MIVIKHDNGDKSNLNSYSVSLYNTIISTKKTDYYIKIKLFIQVMD